MQQLKIEHKSNNQKVVGNSEELENKREGKGRLLATSRNVYRLQNTDTFYVESEACNNLYYYVKYNPSVFEWCSCPDNSIRGQTCKHIFGIIYSIKKATLKDIDKLPAEAKRYGSSTVEAIAAKSYRDDDYDF